MNTYEGKLAELYDDLFDDINQDIEFYQHFIKNNKGICLEIGSGTGRLLLNYLQAGLNVEGLEPSKDMLNICLKKANELNLKPIIYNQSLQNFKTNNKYNTIILPLYVFQNILDKTEAIEALKNIYEILMPKGQVLISIFTPNTQNDSNWEINKIKSTKEHEIILSELSLYDKIQQVQTKQIKHEVFVNNQLKATYSSQIYFKYYSKNELIILLKKIGFKSVQTFYDYNLNQEESDSNTFILSATK